MTRVTIDAATAALLTSVDGDVELLDSSGNLLGWYSPAPPKPTLQELIDSCPTSEEELQRRIREESGSGRTWAEIRRDLEAR
jgi:hypothetical protein